MAKNRKKKRVGNEKQPQGPPEPGAAGPSEVQDIVSDPQPQGLAEPGVAGSREIPSQELAELHLRNEQPVGEDVTTGQSLGAIPKGRPVTKPQPQAEVQGGPPQAVVTPQQVRIDLKFF
jgi:hypothetical protein